MTKQRQAVLTAMRMACGHHTAEEIFEYAKELSPAISRATVYNNLHALEREGMIRALHIDGVADRYDANAIPHGHAVCRSCGGISDLFLPKLAEELSAAIGTDVLAYELNVVTTCAACVQREE